MFVWRGVWVLGGRWGVLRRLRVSVTSGIEPFQGISARTFVKWADKDWSILSCKTMSSEPRAVSLPFGGMR